MSNKVIVFGGSGFLGSHVADALSDSGYEVVLFDCKASPYLRDGQKMIVGDILDENNVEKAVQGCQYVYNFAAIADIDEASQKPLDTVRINILGNSIILEAARKANIDRFLFASSLYVYSKAGSFYRSTKQACELLIENYSEIYNVPFTILRYGTLYGPRADEKNFIFQVIRQALTEGKVIREGDGEEIREYIHIYDAARLSVEILSESFNNKYVIITGDRQMKVKDLLTMVKEIFNNKISIEYKPSTESQHYEITPYSFAPRMARKVVGKTYLDMGQGILEFIHDMYKDLYPLPTYDGLVINRDNT